MGIVSARALLPRATCANTNTNTKYTCDTGQTRNKLLEQWVHAMPTAEIPRHPIAAMEPRHLRGHRGLMLQKDAPDPSPLVTDVWASLPPARAIRVSMLVHASISHANMPTAPRVSSRIRPASRPVVAPAMAPCRAANRSASVTPPARPLTQHTCTAGFRRPLAVASLSCTASPHRAGTRRQGAHNDRLTST